MSSVRGLRHTHAQIRGPREAISIKRNNDGRAPRAAQHAMSRITMQISDAIAPRSENVLVCTHALALFIVRTVRSTEILHDRVEGIGPAYLSSNFGPGDKQESSQIQKRFFTLCPVSFLSVNIMHVSVASRGSVVSSSFCRGTVRPLRTAKMNGSTVERPLSDGGW